MKIKSKKFKNFLKEKPKKLQKEIIHLISLGGEYEEDTDTFLWMGRSFGITHDNKLDEM